MEAEERKILDELNAQGETRVRVWPTVQSFLVGVRCAWFPREDWTVLEYEDRTLEVGPVPRDFLDEEAKVAEFDALPIREKAAVDVEPKGGSLLRLVQHVQDRRGDPGHYYYRRQDGQTVRA